MHTSSASCRRTRLLQDLSRQPTRKPAQRPRPPRSSPCRLPPLEPKCACRCRHPCCRQAAVAKLMCVAGGHAGSGAVLDAAGAWPGRRCSGPQCWASSWSCRRDPLRRTSSASRHRACWWMCQSRWLVAAAQVSRATAAGDGTAPAWAVWACLLRANARLSLHTPLLIACSLCCCARHAATVKLHLSCAGPITPGLSTFVLEAGGGAPGISLAGIRDGLAAGGRRACFYDRLGYGWSDDAFTPTTRNRSTEALWGLLAAAPASMAAPPPFILVGHSAGGQLALQFAASHPDDVAGVALLDRCAMGARDASCSGDNTCLCTPPTTLVTAHVCTTCYCSTSINIINHSRLHPPFRNKNPVTRTSRSPCACLLPTRRCRCTP